MKIVTHQKRIPWSWSVVVLFPWFAFAVREQISNAGMTFTLRKFIESPAMIGRILSSNYLFSLTLGATIAFISDFVWTRWGRRRPFLIISLLGGSILSFFLPASQVGWLTVTLIIAYQFVVDFGGSYEPFTMEVIPPKQRGRSGAITHWYKTAGFAATFYFLIGGFDNVYDLGLFTLSGETLMYWANSLFLGVAGLMVLLFTKEEKPKDFTPVPLKLQLVRRFFYELTRPNMLRLMGLALVMQTLWQGILQYEPLLITDQWGFTKKQYGDLIALSTVTTLALVPVAGWLSDRIDRMVILKIGLSIVVSLHLALYFVADFLVEGQPPLMAVFVVGFLKLSIGSFMAVACVPLLFDYVPKNRLGTLGCGMGLVFALSFFVGANVMGEWIELSAEHFYLLPEGTYNYLAAYHWLILCGLAGIAYLHYFSNLEKRGVIQRLGSQEAVEDDIADSSPAAES